MPRVLILNSTHPDLVVNIPYTLIVRKHGFIFKKMDSNDENSLDFKFMIKIFPDQITKIEIKSDEKEISFLFFEFILDNDTFNFTLSSMELPITVLLDKLRKIIDPLYEEKSVLSEIDLIDSKEVINNEQSLFLQSLDNFIKISENYLKKGVNLLSSSIEGILKTITSVIKPGSNIKALNETFIEKEIELNEILILINKIHINHIDTAYYKEEINDNIVIDNKGKLIVKSQIKSNEETLNKPIMLFIHPFGSDLFIFRPFINYFSHKYRIIAYDQRGHGGSEQHKDDNYSFSDYIKDFNHFLKYKLNNSTENQSIIIVSSSFTGLMLLHNINDLEVLNRPIKLILLNSADKIDEGLQTIIKNLPHPRTWGVLKRTGKNKAKKILFSEKTNGEIKNEILTKFFQSDNRVIFETLKNITHKKYTQGIRRAHINNQQKIEFLILAGEKDIIFNPKYIIDLENLLPKSTIKFLDGNHFSTFEKPLLTIDIIVNWLNNINN